MIGTREQAQVYLAQGSLCRAAAVMQQIVNVEPTKENLELLAEIFMQQGLNEDAMALYAKTVSSHVSTGGYIN
jgi:Tfp pilus assembly protein PilF